MKGPLKEIGIRKALRYVIGQFFAGILKCEWLLSPCRIFLLKLCGSHIGTGSVIHASTFFNIYRGGFRCLKTGHHAFIGNECLLDLADCIELGSHTTLAERVTVLTHTNVGFHDHPLQHVIPSMQAPVCIGDGAFIGINSTIMPGVRIGKEAIVGAGSLVMESVPDRTIVAGVPARVIRKIDENK